MKYYISKTTDAYFNLSMEEYLMKNVDEEIFYIYQNSPSVIIGKNQNPYSEVGIEYLKENGIKLVRRLSGGGAVYHDLGNMNYAFILPGHAKNLYQFKEYSMPIVNVLNKEYNLNIEFSGRNDLIIDGRKISGSAQYVVDDRLLHHGTILYDVDFSNVSKILLPNTAKLETKGVRSVQSRVTNLKALPEFKCDDIFDMVDVLIKNIADDGEYQFTQQQLEDIEIIAEGNRRAIQFIMTNQKEYQNHNVEYIPGFGTIEIYSNIKEGKIEEIAIFGEYFFKNDLDEIKNSLVGVEFTKQALLTFFERVENFEEYFHRLSKEKLVELIIGEK